MSDERQENIARKITAAVSGVFGDRCDMDCKEYAALRNKAYEKVSPIIAAALKEYAEGLRHELEDQSACLRSVKMLAENYRVQNEGYRIKLAVARKALTWYLDIAQWAHCAKKALATIQAKDDEEKLRDEDDTGKMKVLTKEQYQKDALGFLRDSASGQQIGITGDNGEILIVLGTGPVSDAEREAATKILEGIEAELAEGGGEE